MSAIEMEKGISEEAERAQTFFEAIGRPDLCKIITAKTPLVNVATEMLPGLIAGGFGALEQDEVRERWRLGIPSIDLTLFLNSWEQKIVNLEQREEPVMADPEKLGFERKTEVSIAANSHHEIKLEVFTKREGSQMTVALREQGIGELYQGEPGEEHRLYQDAVLGFGGYKALKKLKQLGVIDQEEPSAIRLNEASAVFFGVAYLDDLIRQGMSFPEALTKAQKKITYTNHTLVPVANPGYPREWYQRYIFPNVGDSVRRWIEEMCSRDGLREELNLSMLTMELAGRFNGVSQRHAAIASKKFQRLDGSAVEFEPVTNGVSLSRWAHPEFLALYLQNGIITKGTELPDRLYLFGIERLDSGQLRAIKNRAKEELRVYLRGRFDQYGALAIPFDSTIAVWARRLSGYKRPEMLFADPERLAQILERENRHLILGGKVHKTDSSGMREILKDILQTIDEHPVLRERVHFIQNYEEEAAKYLVRGADIWINTPVDGYDNQNEDQEACGTSSLKAIPNLTVVVSTKSGGMADVRGETYFRIRGNNYPEQVVSLYTQLEEAMAEVTNGEKWSRRVKSQLQAFLPIVCGGRMIEDYLNFIYPKAA